MLLLLCVSLLASPPVIPNSWQSRPCLVVTLHRHDPRWPEPDYSSMWEQIQSQGQGQGGGRGGEGGDYRGKQDGPSHHNHSLPAVPSVLAPLPLFMLFCSAHVKATRRVYQLSPGWSESSGSGGRRLVKSPEAANCPPTAQTNRHWNAKIKTGTLFHRPICADFLARGPQIKHYNIREE